MSSSSFPLDILDSAQPSAQDGAFKASIQLDTGSTGTSGSGWGLGDGVDGGNSSRPKAITSCSSCSQPPSAIEMWPIPIPQRCLQSSSVWLRSSPTRHRWMAGSRGRDERSSCSRLVSGSRTHTGKPTAELALRRSSTTNLQSTAGRS